MRGALDKGVLFLNLRNGLEGGPFLIQVFLIGGEGEDGEGGELAPSREHLLEKVKACPTFTFTPSSLLNTYLSPPTRPTLTFSPILPHPTLTRSITAPSHALGGVE